MKKGRFPMGATDSPVITCPVCGAQGAKLHHDVRASLIYACQQCMHEWQIDPAEEIDGARVA
jgi:hypothetical protein